MAAGFRSTRRLRGALLALGGAIGQADSLILAKWGATTNPSDRGAGIAMMNPFAGTQIRIIAGLLGFALVVTASGSWRGVVKGLKDMKAVASRHCSFLRFLPGRVAESPGRSVGQHGRRLSHHVDRSCAHHCPFGYLLQGKGYSARNSRFRRRGRGSLPFLPGMIGGHDQVVSIALGLLARDQCPSKLRSVRGCWTASLQKRGKP